MDSHHLVASDIPSKDSGELVASFRSGFIERFAHGLKDFDAGPREAGLDAWSFSDARTEA